MQGIKGDLSKFLARMGLLNNYYHQKAMSYWTEVVGEEISNNCQPTKIQDGTMIVVCAHPMWIQELSFRKKQLIKQLNKKVGKNVVYHIKFITGSVPSKHNGKNNQDKEAPPDLEESEQHWVDNIAQNVQDDELKEKIKNIVTQDLKYKKKLQSKGYVTCSKCSCFTKSENGICYQCQKQSERDEINDLIALLKDSPWFTFDEVAAHIEKEISQTQYNQAKSFLFNQVKDELKKARNAYKYFGKQENYDWLKEVLNQYVLIVSEQKPQMISTDVWRTVVGALGRDYLKLIDN